jgi:hypothetical protein
MEPRYSLKVDSPEEVDALLEHVWNHGARVVKPGAPTGFGGYSCYFTDADGLLWEIAHSPESPPRRESGEQACRCA